VQLTIWFRAMWQIASQKNAISALGPKRVLDLGSYKASWAMLHKLRRAMVRPGRDRLSGTVEVDETYRCTEESGLIGRLAVNKAIIAVAVEDDGRKIGRRQSTNFKFSSSASSRRELQHIRICARWWRNSESARAEVWEAHPQYRPSSNRP